MSKTSEIGRIGEDIACEYLKKCKYKILLRNVRLRSDEIDIICREEKSKILVFIEVKTMSSNPVFKPEDHYSREKERKFKRACILFSTKHANLIREKSGWRMDLMAIEIINSLLTDIEKDCVINHYQNVIAKT